jgi:hypothetical protein
MDFILWIVAVCLVLYGIFRVFTGSILWGIFFIVLGLLVGPGGVSLLS